MFKHKCSQSLWSLRSTTEPGSDFSVCSFVFLRMDAVGHRCRQYRTSVKLWYWLRPGETERYDESFLNPSWLINNLSNLLVFDFFLGAHFSWILMQIFWFATKPCEVPLIPVSSVASHFESRPVPVNRTPFWNTWSYRASKDFRSWCYFRTFLFFMIVCVIHHLHHPIGDLFM